MWVKVDDALPKTMGTSEPSPFLVVEEVLEQLDLAKRFVAMEAMASFEAWARRDVAIGRSESPLEAIFVIWWTAFQATSTENTILRLLEQQEVEVGGETYRLDFVIVPSEHAAPSLAGQPYPKIVVEVDGHGFHEKTREQVTRGNQRDRALQQAGWRVFHISWSEMVNRTQGARAVDTIINHALDCYYAALPPHEPRLSLGATT